ncbi:MAG: dTDP-4-dehydrorhamnose reductase [Thermodesulfobacteriota bacterium]
MKILVSGCRGMLGVDLMRVLASAHEVVGVDLEEVDITDLRAVEEQVAALAPDVLINAAAYTDVDKSEQQEDVAFRVNADGAANLALACRAGRIRLVHVSTDYVFDGKAERPYSEEDPPNPLGVYGRSKWEGEKRIREILPGACLIRTAWLYGKAGKNFVKAILVQAGEKNRLRVVDDQRGSPTYTLDLAMALQSAAEKGLEGTYHVTNQGSCSWLGFAEKILELSGKKGVAVEPISTEELGRAAPRPRNSVLDCRKFEKATGMKLRRWPEALQDYLFG